MKNHIKRILATALCVVMLAPTFALASEGNPFYSDPIDLSDLFGDGEVDLYTPGAITITSPVPATATEYDLTDFTDSVSFLVRYAVADGWATKDTVLVIDKLAYGIDWASTLTVADNAAFKAVAYFGNSVAVALNDNLTGEVVVNFTLKQRALTQAECVQWMDTGSLASNFTVAEYSYPEGALANIKSATPQAQVDYFTDPAGIAPANYTDNKVSNRYSYRLGVSNYPVLSDFMMQRAGLPPAGSYTSTDIDAVFPGPKEPILMYEIPTTHLNGAPLMEMKHIKIYVPDERLELVSADSPSDPERRTSVAIVADYTGAVWNNWKISEPYTDDVINATYYLLTPVTRIFNNATAAKNNQNLTYGMRLRWKLKPDERLDYSDTEVTIHEAAAQTEFVYNVPNGTSAPAEITYGHDGPQVRTPRASENTIMHAWAGERHRTNTALNTVTGLPNNAVTIGAAYANQALTYVNNGWNIAGGVEYMPRTDGAMTQTYEFPYEIQPYTMRLTENAYQRHATFGNRTKIKAITYTLWDGGTYTIDASTAPETIDSINAFYANATVAGTPVTIVFTEATEQHPVWKVAVEWECVQTLYGPATVKNNINRGLGAVNSANGYTLLDTVGTNNTSYANVRTDFSYRVSPYEKPAGWVGNDPISGYDGEGQPIPATPVPDGKLVQAVYKADLNAGGALENANYLYWQLREAPCPVLVADTLGDRNNVIGSFLADGVTTHNIGSFAIDVGTVGERKDLLLNPRFNFSSKFVPGYYHNISTNTANIPGIAEAETIAFLSGQMDARPALDGWEFVYTAYDSATGTDEVRRYLIQFSEEEKAAGRKTIFLLEPGEYFKSLSLEYQGYFDTGHPVDFEGSGRDPADSWLASNTARFIPLVGNIRLRYLVSNPFTGARIMPTAPYSTTYYRLRGHARYDNCSCQGTKAHANAPGQHSVNITDANNPLVNHPGTHMNFAGALALYQLNAPTVNSGSDVFQGAKTRANMTFDIRTNKDQGVGSVGWSNAGGQRVPFGEYLPWGIAEAVFVELTDPAFMPAYEDCSLYGVPYSSGNVVIEQVEADGRTFLKLSYVNGFQRTATGLGTPAFSATHGSKLVQVLSLTYGSVNTNYARVVAGAVNIGFKTLASTPPGDHWPIGDVYLDFSELLDKHTFTPSNPDSYFNWRINGAVADTLGLASSASTANKLLRYNYQQGSATEYRVKITETGAVGAIMYPGKSMIQFNENPLVTTFRSFEKDDLNALVSISSDSEYSIYDVTAFIPVPKAGKSVTGIGGSGMSGSFESQFDMFMRAAPDMLSNGTGIADPGNITFAYTTNASPDEASDYSYDPTAGGNSWDAVTGLRILIKEIPQSCAVDIRLHLRSDDKDALGAWSAYSGGPYQFAKDIGGGGFTTSVLPVVEWRYLDYDVATGTVFWDHNEDGEKAATEPFAQGVTVRLYEDATLANEIHSAVSNAQGQFALKSYTNAEGQVMVIDMPVQGDGSTVKLTRVLNPGEPSQSNLDSDFDRVTRALTLPTFTPAGIYNISAGLVKLPKLAVADQVFQFDETPDAYSASSFTSYFTGDLPASPVYRIVYGAPDDPTVVDFNETTDAANTVNGSVITPALVGVGTTTAKAWVVNTLGDKVEVTYTITVEKPAEYNITYVGLTGNAADDPDPKPTAYTVLELPKSIGTPSKLGYTFEGWKVNYQDDSLTDIIVADPNYTAIPNGTTGDVELTAVWEAVPYDIEYELDGGTNAHSNPSTYTVEDLALAIANPSKTGHAFDGWTAAYEDGTATVTVPDDAYSIPQGTTKTVNLTAHWVPNKHNITYSYTTPAGSVTPTAAMIALLPAGEDDVPYDTPKAVTTAPSLTGYTFVGWSTSSAGTGLSGNALSGDSFAMPDNAVAFTGYWTANTNTKYIVEHYKVDGSDASTLADTENLTGTTGETATASPKSYTGYTYTESYTGTVKSGTIAADGTLILKLYYTVNKHNITYSYTTPAGSVTPIAAMTALLPAGESDVPYGTAKTVATAPTLTGYTFHGWTTDDAAVSGGSFTMPDNAVAFTGYWTANSGTKYQVEHYKVDGNDAAILADTDDFTGTTGDTATASPRTYTGYTYAEGYTGTVKTGTIAADGSLVLKLYYTANKYNITYAYTGTVPTGAPSAPATDTGVAFGVAKTVATAPTLAGYSFSGWTTVDAAVSGGSFTMPDNAVAFTGSWTANSGIKYTVEHYKVDGNGTATLADTDSFTGTTNETATASPRSYTGHTYDEGYTGTVKSGTIAADGSLILKLYYTVNKYGITYAYTTPTGSVTPTAAMIALLPADETVVPYGTAKTVATAPSLTGYTFHGWSTPSAGTGLSGSSLSGDAYTMPDNAVAFTGYWTANTNTKYTVEHYKVDGSGTATLADTEDLSGTTGETATASPKSYTGYTYTEGYVSTVKSGTILADGSLVLKLYYTINKYNITYVYTTPAGSVTPVAAMIALLPADEDDVPFGTAKTVETAPSLAGYTFHGWTTDDAAVSGGSFTMPDNTVAFTGYWTANSGTKYKVEHYKVDGSDIATLANTDDFTGITGDTATASPRTYTGYTHDEDYTGTVKSGTIAADGSLVLKLYYTVNKYDITYAYTGTVPTGAPSAPSTDADVPFGTAKTVATAPTLTGYTFHGWTTDDTAVSGGSFTMPDNAVAFTGSWTPSSGTKYKVEHYKVDGSDTATLANTDDFTGTTGDTATASPRTYTGYTYDEGYTGTVKSGTIAADGSLVLKLYYTANKNNITYAYTGTVPTGAPNAPATETGVAFGTSKTVESAPTLTGYTFSGWTTVDVAVSGGSFTMPDNAVVFTCSWTANTNTKYIVEHYRVDAANVVEAIPFAADNLTGTTGATVNASPKTGVTGHTYSAAYPGTVASGTVAADGSLVLKLYYPSNNHNITYRYTNPPAGAPTVPAVESVPFGTNKTVWEPGVMTGYTFDGWTPTGVAETSGDFTMPDNAVTFTGTWSAKDVEVRFYNNHSAADNSRYDVGDAANAGKKFGEALATFAAPTRTGYDLTGWFTARSGGTEYVPGTSVIDTEGPLELYAQWTLKRVEVRFFLNYSPTDNTRYATGDAANAGKVYGDMLSSFADPVRDGYEFVGWFTARTGGTQVIPSAVMLNTEGPLELFAQWVSTHVTIRYRTSDAAMGAISLGSESLHKTLDTAKGSTAQANPGYVFVNWTDAQGNVVGTGATFVPAKVGGENVEATYTANFREMDAVTIYYVAREGGSTYPSASRVNPVTGEPARSTATAAPGYVFVNWTDAQGNVVSTGLSYRPRKADHEVWRDGTTFYANFAIASTGTISIPITKVWDVPEGVTKLPNVTVTLRRDGKPYRTLQLGVGNWSGSFDGVPKSAPNGSAYMYTVSENTLPGFTLTGVTGSVETGFTLTNTARELTVTFVDWNGNLLKQQTVPYGGSATPPDDPTRDGHEFAGWIGRYENVTRNEYVYAKYRRVGDGVFSLLDAAIPLAGGAVSNFGDCIE